MLESSLIKLQTLKTVTLLKRDSSTGFFCESCEIFRNILFYRASPVPVSSPNSFRFSACKFVKKETPEEMIFVNSLGASSDRIPLDDYFLYLPVNFEKFFRTQLLYSTSGKLPMKQLFYDKNIMFNRKKINNRNTLAKYFTWQKHSVIAKFKILKGLKKFKKI